MPATNGSTGRARCSRGANGGCVTSTMKTPTGPAILLCIMGYLIELDPLPNALIHWPQPASAASAVSPELNDDLEPIGTAKSIPPSRRRICGPQPRIEKDT